MTGVEENATGQAGTGGALADAMATPDQPAPASNRIVTLDLIRGIAVLGILFANITAFGQPLMVYFWPPAMPGGASETDKLAWLVQYVLIDHKMRGMFSLLFGAGMMLFVEKAWARGAGRWLQFRRLFWLLMFGSIHFYFIWLGDILQLYAVWGMVALLFMKWRAKTQLLVGLALYGLTSAAMVGMMGSPYYMVTHPEAVQNFPEDMRKQVAEAESKSMKRVQEELQLHQQGSYADFVRHQLTEEWKDNYQNMIFGFLETLPLIMIGMALYRFGFFSGAVEELMMRRWGWIGLIGGLAGSAAAGWWAYAADFPFHLTAFAFNGTMMLPRLAFVLGLAALLVVWAPRFTKSYLGDRLVYAGRMAFSNYLGTSIIMLFIFSGWALGLYGKLHRIELFGVVLLTWSAMLLWSKPWLERFRYGPLEWLWRCLTYMRIFPLKR
ncbi:DUF418 domain-containing protein [Erythrobacteraceae bacterium E2-1 Yellow Sea]|nr:DUF418 domain-containing protein [Erythrobacteraceae bacterium E2-1 Yellow Sea]